ncbi:hypothetical protein NQ317_009895 [Molorchus minor]|uniref:Uncharacterized protein n=1 Tax=Molorchus minor TaxID=1323400 RepID=A0ABQ9IVB3_9CUCU|nr:hypothetical protein NQ317_009895 [Molorchus minor]
MVMGQFVTTYRKDYLWPYVKTLGTRPEPERLYQPQFRDDKVCPCHCVPNTLPTSEQTTMLGPAAAGEEAWSRLGPMGPLLDPKMYPAKVSSAPESKVSRYNQPNAFLKKLQEKYPFLYECLRTAPPDDLIARVNKDRLLSTYQVDFCKKQEIPSESYDSLVRAAGLEGLPPCPEPARLPGDVVRPGEKSRISQRVGGGKACGGIPKPEENKQCVGSCKAGPLASMTPGATEYQDTVSRLGTLITREGLHDPRKPPAKTGHIITWHTPACDDKLIDTWGNMAYRDSIHAHGGRRARRGVLKK